MRTLVKGGVWKNTEDEILKAAVMKYGKNQWSRISSLLVRKTAKQCKARWYEWLDPSIKKTEWSKEEDEKLLHLAKLMPCQWRTIAPIVGRTAAQCLNRYERLLDEAQGKERLSGEDDPRRLRPGEIDPAPEIKPARPDPVDMDEDEKEMLSEARARLANTQGKKAKRKAREKQLEEARRLASLQKKRELKAAGIDVHDHKNRKKRKNVDYNAEIPFHKPVPHGFYDTSEESRNTVNIQFTGRRLDQIEGKRRDDQEEERRKRDLKRARELEKNDPVLSIKVDSLMKEDGSSSKLKLSLPTPQITERELEDIVKLGYEGENRRSILSSEEHQASAALLGNYNLVAPTPLRTPRVGPSLDSVRLEAQNLAALQSMQTPLLGGSNVPLHATSFEGTTPRRQVQQTPSHLRAAFTPARSMTSMSSLAPKGEIHPFQTPLTSSHSQSDATPSVEEDFKDRSGAVLSKKHISDRGLVDGLARLPQPKHEFEIEISEDTDLDKSRTEKFPEQKAFRDAESHPGGLSTSDSSSNDRINRTFNEEIKRKKILLDAEHSSRMKLLTSKGLRAPKSVNTQILETLDGTQKSKKSLQQLADQLLVRELVCTLDLDVTRTTPAYQSTLGVTFESTEAFEKAELDLASLLITEEKRRIETKLGFDSGSLDLKVYETCWQDLHSNFVVSLKQKAYIRAHTGDSRVVHLQQEFGTVRQRMFKDATVAAAMEAKLQTLLRGHQSRSNSTLQKLTETYEAIEQTRLEHDSMRFLNDLERENVPRRLESLEMEIESLKKAENDLMTHYHNLIARRDSLLTS